MKPKAVVLVLFLAGCAAELDAGQHTRAMLAFNAMTLNAMTANALAMNAMTYNGAVLDPDGIDAAGLDLADPDAHLAMEYLVSCALPDEAEVSVDRDGATYRFAGELGLAPEWADGPCGEDCQRWVSACLLARVNARGERVAISMRAPHPSLRAGAHEMREFSREEATFMGNLAVDPPVMLAAPAADDVALPRTCGDDVDACPIEIIGSSADQCDRWAQPFGRFDCHHPDGEPWPQAVTIYLAR